MYTCDRERGKGEGREGRGREGREGLLSVTDHTSKANPSTEHELKYLLYIIILAWHGRTQQ